MIRAALLALVVAGAARADWTPPTATDVALLAADEALILVDMGQTIGACRDPFAVMCEGGLGILVLGQKPSTEAIVRASVGTMIGTAALWLVLPDGWRKTLTLTIGVGEGLNVTHNALVGAAIRF